MNSLRILGTALIFGTSVWAGLHGAWSLRRETDRLLELAEALQYMEHEISCEAIRFSPLCRRLSRYGRGSIGAYFGRLAQAESVAPGGSAAARKQVGLQLPEPVGTGLDRLMDEFGAFDLESQVARIEGVRQEVLAERARRCEGLETQCRIRRLLGLCAGAAAWILVA